MIPERYLNARISDFIEGTLPDSDLGWIILGPVGTGKTHLACAICNETRGESMFASVHNWLEAIRCEYDGGECRMLPPEKDKVEQSYCPAVYIEPTVIKGRTIAQRAWDASVIAIDDFGTSKKTPWTEEQLLSIVNDRLDNGRRVVITSNLTLKQIKDSNERIFDRLRYLKVVLLKGKSRRQKEG